VCSSDLEELEDDTDEDEESPSTLEELDD
jgi:hypothetical protein